MRWTLAVLVGLGVLVSGCTGGSPGPTSENSGDEAQEGDGGVAEEGMALPEVLEAPGLAVGTAWTYATEGFWDSRSSVTIVVAESGPGGSLLAATVRDELDNELAWDVPYLGRFDGSMRAQHSDHLYAEAGPHGASLVEFPLEDGKTWSYWSTEVTARAATVDVLGEDEHGFRIEGEDDRRRVLVEYAPSVGFVTLFEDFNKIEGEAAWTLRLTAVGNVSQWAWYERGAEIADGGVVVSPGGWDPVSGDPPVSPPTVLVVGAEDESVVIWAMAAEGSTALVVPPQGGPEPWRYEGEGLPNFEFAWFDAVEGDWTFTGVPGSVDGWSYLQGHAVRWIDGAL